MNNLQSPSGAGRSYRTGISLIELFRIFSDNAIAKRWLEQSLGGKDGAECPRCESKDKVKEAPSRKLLLTGAGSVGSISMSARTRSWQKPKSRIRSR